MKKTTETAGGSQSTDRENRSKGEPESNKKKSKKIKTSRGAF